MPTPTPFLRMKLRYLAKKVCNEITNQTDVNNARVGDVNFSGGNLTLNINAN